VLRHNNGKSRFYFTVDFIVGGPVSVDRRGAPSLWRQPARRCAPIVGVGACNGQRETASYRVLAPGDGLMVALFGPVTSFTSLN